LAAIGGLFLRGQPGIQVWYSLHRNQKITMFAKRKHKQPSKLESVNLGFQIAPMIDVVFVIMLFFMVMAGTVRTENELRQQLPGGVTLGLENLVLPDEIIVGVEETGDITLNEELMDAPGSKAMPNFVNAMSRLRQEADGRKSKVLVTIQAAEQAKYDRVVDVLNSLAQAKVSNVTFTVGGQD
jgi:biopolymer transport protein ExbD